MWVCVAVPTICESLVSPGATVPERYLPVRAQSRAGEEVLGVRVNEDSFTIQLRDPVGRIHSLSKLDLENLDKAFGESLMPSYESDLSESELEDLVAWGSRSRLLGGLRALALLSRALLLRRSARGSLLEPFDFLPQGLHLGARGETHRLHCRRDLALHETLEVVKR